MSYTAHATLSRCSGGLPPATAELCLEPDERPLWMMARLSAVSLKLLDRIEAAAEGCLEAEDREAIFGKLDLVTAFTRLSRAMRQIAVLEAEMVGEREPSQGRIWSDAERMGSILPEPESDPESDDDPEGEDGSEP